MEIHEQDFTILQGATFSQVIRYYQDVEQTNPVDLTGYTAKLQLKRLIEDETAALELTNESGITITPLEGKIELEITPEQTEDLTDRYYYDLKLTSSGGEVDRIIQGEMIIDEQVTT